MAEEVRLDRDASDKLRALRMRAEYRSRINRVMDYIETHLAEDLSLATLARVAGFSQFHFHRIFSAMVGETLNQFIGRVRVEKAAAQLLVNPSKSITEIAFDCGFSGSASFARAFRDAFHMSASQWRSGGYQDHDRYPKQESKNGKTTSKNGKAVSKDEETISKDREDPSTVFLHVDPVTGNFTWRLTMKEQKKSGREVNVEVKEMPELCVAYVRHMGPYKGDAELFKGLFEKLMKWAGPRGLLHFPETQVLSVYHDDPNITDEQKLRVSACITVSPDTQVDGEIGKMTVPGGRFAVGHFELGDNEYQAAWDALIGGWFPESGYQPDDGLCYELCLSNPDDHPKRKCRVDICIPVKPL